MKKYSLPVSIILFVASLIFFLFSYTMQNSKSDNQLFSKALEGEYFLPPFFPASKKQGEAIPFKEAKDRVKRFQDHIMSNIFVGNHTIRSFYLDANIFKTFYDSNAHDTISYFKLVYAFAPNTKKITMIIVAFDKRGDYLYAGKNNDGDNLVFDQIAPCPDKCPDLGPAKCDNLQEQGEQCSLLPGNTKP